jgi:large repetitive protein
MTNTRRSMVPIMLLATLALSWGGTSAQAASATAPGAPRSVAAGQHHSGGAQVTWKAPVSTGGSAITGYVVTPYKSGVPQPALTFTTPKTTRIVTGLQNGKPYRFKVAAINAVATGAGSALSTAINVGAPGLPRIWEVQPISPRSKVHVRYLAIPENAARITRVDATCTSSNGGVTRTGGWKTTHVIRPIWATVVKLTIGKTYTCTVVAGNAYGLGLHSKPSAPVTL